jgi:hypothetical protein
MLWLALYLYWNSKMVQFQKVWAAGSVDELINDQHYERESKERERQWQISLAQTGKSYYNVI